MILVIYVIGVMPRPGPWIPAPVSTRGRPLRRYDESECEGTFVLLFRIRGVRTVVKGDLDWDARLVRGPETALSDMMP